MNMLEEIQSSVRTLSASDLAQFREWFFELDADLWDKQFEDVQAGKLDQLAKQAIADFRAGQCKGL